MLNEYCDSEILANKINDRFEAMTQLRLNSEWTATWRRSA
jgi:hypothetical protein